MGLRISQAEMDSKKRINRIESLLTDALAHMEDDPQLAEDVTYNELQMALNNAQGSWLRRAWKEEVGSE